jgi:NTP pyrophosphatase (non-canonical NTP hydrolase)
VQDSEEWFPGMAHDLPFLTLALCGEAGELANLVKKAWRQSHTEEELRAKMEGEATDILVYLCNIFGYLNMDPFEAYQKVRANNTKRFGKGANA